MKAQGATEYLVLMSVVLGIALICVAILVWPTGSTKDVKASQTDIKCGIAKNAVPDIMQGMVAYYKLDEGSGTTPADRKGGVTGVLSSSASWAIGKSGSALLFDGASGYANVSSSNYERLPNTSGTISMWVKPTRLFSYDNFGLFVSAYGNHGYGRWGVFALENKAMISVYAQGVAYRQVSSVTTIPAGSWTHIAGVYDRGSQRVVVYVNGNEENSTSFLSSDIIEPSDARSDAMGANVYASGITQFFNGSIDEVLIYNRVLSADEIKFLAQYPGCP